MTVTLTPLFPGVPGGLELAVILLIAVLLFGANKIPKLARSTGQAMGEFQKGRQEVETELEKMREGASIEDLEDSPESSTDTTETTTTETVTDTETATETETESESDTEKSS